MSDESRALIGRPMPELRWICRARVHKLRDGDTVELFTDSFFSSYHIEPVRLFVVDTPERKAGAEATAFVRDWLHHAAIDSDDPEVREWPLLVETEKLLLTDEADNFVRYLGWIYRRSDGQFLQDALLAAGLAMRRYE